MSAATKEAVKDAAKEAGKYKVEVSGVGSTGGNIRIVKKEADAAAKAAGAENLGPRLRLWLQKAMCQRVPWVVLYIGMCRRMLAAKQQVFSCRKVAMPKLALFQGRQGRVLN